MIDILIPTYNRNSRLETVLYGLTLQNPKLPENYRIVICDDNSPDSASDTVNQFKDKLNIEYYRNDTNTGSSAVRRFLVKQIKQNYIWWLDDDVVPYEDTSFKHIQNCRSLDTISVGTMEDVVEEVTDELLKLPLIERIDRFKSAAIPEKRYQFINPENHKRAWGGCWTGNLMMLKDQGDKIGWLDEEAVGWGHDDTIMTAKLVGEGYLMKYDINTRGVHLRQDINRKGNLGRGYYDTAIQNAKVLDKWLKYYNITWTG